MSLGAASDTLASDWVATWTVVGLIGALVCTAGAVALAERMRPRGHARVDEAMELRGARARAAAMLVGGVAVLGLVSAGAIRGSWVIGLPVVAMLAYTLRDTAEDLLAGAFLGMHPAYRRGNLVRIGEWVGRIESTGLLRLQVQSTDDGDLYIPNRVAWRDRVVNLSRIGADTPVEVVLPIPTDLDARAAMALAVVCAGTSPYASLHKRPDTFLEYDRKLGERPMVRVRGYVFDPTHAETFRSHIVEAWLESTRPNRPATVTRVQTMFARAAMADGAERAVRRAGP